MKGYGNEGLKRKYEVRTKDRNRTKLWDVCLVCLGFKTVQVCRLSKLTLSGGMKTRMLLPLVCFAFFFRASALANLCACVHTYAHTHAHTQNRRELVVPVQSLLSDSSNVNLICMILSKIPLELPWLPLSLQCL